MLMISQTEFNSILERNFAPFCQRCFEELEGKKLHLANYLRALTWMMSCVAGGEVTRLIINMPPRHLKSQVVSVMWVAWILRSRPSASFAILSYDEKLAHQLAASLKRLIRSKWYREFAPNVRIQSGEDRAHDFRTTEGGRVYAGSIESGITGHGFDFIILDDPQSAIGASSETDRHRLHATFDSAIATRLDDQRTGVIVLVQQRLHEDDLSGHLLRRGGWTNLRLPLIAPEDTLYTIGRGELWRRPEGHITRPDQFPPGSDAKIIANSGLATFSSQYQQDPSVMAGNLIKPEQIRRIESLPPSAKTYYVAVDTASEVNANSNFTVFMVIATDGTNHYIVDVKRARIDIDEMAELALRLHTRWGITKFIIEQASLGSALHSMLERRGIPAHKQPVGTLGKEARLLKHLNYFADGEIFVVGDQPWISDFIGEILRFPIGRYDDQVDALTTYLQYISEKHIPAPHLATRALTLEQGDRPYKKGDHPLRPRR